MRWAVFFDRDGVLTEAPIVDDRAGSPRCVRDLRFLEGAAEAVAELRDVGALVFVVTNQPDVARGNLVERDLEAMHEKLIEFIHVDEIRACPHDTGDRCECRKPQPGMLVDLAQAWDVDLTSSWMVGDRWVDIAAGEAAGTHTILVDRPYSWNSTSQGGPRLELAPDYRVADVREAVRLIVRMSGSRHPVP